MFYVHEKYILMFFFLQILDLLEEYRIGNLEETRSSLETINDPYDSDPPRHKALKPASLKPFNAEPPLQILADDFHTPKYETFSIRLTFSSSNRLC